MHHLPYRRLHHFWCVTYICSVSGVCLSEVQDIEPLPTCLFPVNGLYVSVYVL